MSLLGSFIDSRTIAAINAAASTSFAHGLPAAPDLVIVNETVSAATNVSALKLFGVGDATNVSVYNHGEGNSQVLKVVSMVAHSVIR